MTKERYQNPKVGDELVLRLLTYNDNQLANVNHVQKVEIWKVDDQDPNNLKKRTLMQTIDGDEVANERTGEYYVELLLEDSVYCIGRYVDVWYLGFEQHDTDECHIAPVDNRFEIKRDLWFTSPTPLVYDFNFAFKPNRFVQGSKQYLIVNVTPNAPTATEIEQYYRNLATISPLKISIAQRCGDCVPEEQDLRLIVDRELVQLREKCLGFYWLDTSEMDCGIYDVWFQLELANNVYISPKSQLQIFV